MRKILALLNRVGFVGALISCFFVGKVFANDTNIDTAEFSVKYQLSGGFAGFNTVLSVSSDGRFEYSDKREAISGELSKEELEELINYVVEENKIFDISTFEMPMHNTRDRNYPDKMSETITVQYGNKVRSIDSLDRIDAFTKIKEKLYSYKEKFNKQQAGSGNESKVKLAVNLWINKQPIVTVKSKNSFQKLIQNILAILPKGKGSESNINIKAKVQYEGMEDIEKNFDVVSLTIEQDKYKEANLEFSKKVNITTDKDGNKCSEIEIRANRKMKLILTDPIKVAIIVFDKENNTQQVITQTAKVEIAY